MATRYTAAEQAELLKWPRRMGVGFIEANVPEKKVSLEKWPEIDLSKVDYEREIQTGKYDNGIAIRLGKTFFGKYITALDFDSWPTILAYFGTKDKVRSWANDTLIEWHEDWGSLHVLVLTDEPLTNRKIAVGSGGYLEIRGMGQLLFASPSTHTDGNKWQAVGKAASPKLLNPLEVTRLRVKIDGFCDDYVSTSDKEKYQAYLEHYGTVLGVKQGRHDATLFIALRYYWAYKDGWLTFTDEERFNRAWKWHETHCKPKRSRKEFDAIRKWIEDKHRINRDNWFSRIHRENEEKAQIRFNAKESERLLIEQIKAKEKDIPILSVSEALRFLPEMAERSTDIVKVKGMISGYKELHVMVVGWTAVCPYCRKVYHKDYKKPLFDALFHYDIKCIDLDSERHPLEFSRLSPSQDTKDKKIFEDDQGNKLEMVFDKEGKPKRSIVWLDVDYDFRDAVEIDLQDTDKHEEISTLKTLLFGDDTKEVRLGERIVVTGKLWIETFTSSKDARLHKRLYAHSIEYTTRREIAISNLDRMAIERFVKRFGDNTVKKLSEMFAVDLFGNMHVKFGLLLCAASCGEDTENIQKYNRRTRINGFLIGDTGTAKSPFLRKVVRIVIGSMYESMQNTTTKSLTAIISKEGESKMVRLGPAALAKGAILAANELGRTSAEDDLSQLLDVLEEGKFSVNKYGFRLPDIHSPTVVIGSANPKVDREDNTRFDINDMGIIRPIIDRFDLIFVLRIQRGKDYLREYNKHKNKYEYPHKAPNYDTYLEKHLLYCRRINPAISDEAMTILSDFYSSIAQKYGSPRLRETLFRCIKMVARLKLKTEADDKDAFEVCEFMNQLLQDRQEITNIPTNPKDYAFQEFLYKLEAHKEPITADELIEQVCFNDDYLESYIGPNHKHRENKKLRGLISLLLIHPRVRKVQMKPIVMQWIPKTSSAAVTVNEDKPKDHNKDCTCARCAPCAPENTIPLSEKQVEITSGTGSDERNHAQQKGPKTQKMNRNMEKTRAHRAHRAHSNNQALDFDTNKVKVVNLMNEHCDILIGRMWPKGKSNPPLAMEDYLGNPYVILKEGQEPTEPWHCKTREEALSKFKEWLYHGKEIVHHRDPGEYRRKALDRLPGHYKWGCFCAPEKCHGDVLKSWLRLKLRLKRRYTSK